MPSEDEKKKTGHESKRVHKRVDFFNPVKVVVPDENTAVDVFAGNVSKGGMFLRSNRPLPKGKKVKLEFETKEGKVEVEEGEVVWNKEFEPISIDGSPAGMGVEFKSMSEDSKLKIEAFIDDALHAQPQPEEQPPPPSRQEPPQPEPAPVVEADPVDEAEPAAEPMRMKLDVVTSQPPPPSQPPPQAEGGKEDMATAPPRRRTKMMLFGGFVLLVAAVTFLTLLLIKPPGDKQEGEVAKPPAPEKLAPSQAPEKKPEPVPEKKPEPIAEKKPKPLPEKKPEPVPEKPHEKPGRQTPPKPEPPPTDAIQGLQVGLPVFAEKDGEWRMIITATGPVEVKHFTLKNPPRLAVDFKGAVYSGKSRTQESPAPPVARVRVGEQPEFTRFVLDFNGPEVPQHRIVKKEDRVVVFFGR